MRVHLHPQRRTVEVAGRRSVGRLLAELGVLPSTAMVIRRDELLTDGEMVEDDDEIEIRAVISGGATDGQETLARVPPTVQAWRREDARASGRPDVPSEAGALRPLENTGGFALRTHAYGSTGAKRPRARGQSVGSREGTHIP